MITTGNRHVHKLGAQISTVYRDLTGDAIAMLITIDAIFRRKPRGLYSLYLDATLSDRLRTKLFSAVTVLTDLLFQN